MQSPNNALHSVRFSHQGQFYMLSTSDACGHHPASPQTNPAIFTLFHHLSDFSPQMAAPGLSTSALTWLRFWRVSITNHRTPGSPSTSSFPYWLFGPFPPTPSTNNSEIDPRWGLRIFRHTLNNADTELVASCTSVVGRYIPWVVWKVILSRLSSCNIFWWNPEWKAISEQTGSPANVSENSSMLGGIPESSSVSRFVLTAEMMKRYIAFFFGTKKWAFLKGPQTGLNRPCRTLSSIISSSTGMTFFGMWNMQSFQTSQPDSSRIRCGSSTTSLIVPSSYHVHERAYSLFDSITTRASSSFGQNILPIHCSRNLSGINLPPPAPSEKFGINHSSQGSGIGTAWAIALPFQLSSAFHILPSDKGTSFNFCTTHL